MRFSDIAATGWTTQGCCPGCTHELASMDAIWPCH